MTTTDTTALEARLAEACDSLVGKRIVSLDTTIGDGGDQDAHYGELTLDVTMFQADLDLDVHDSDRIIDSVVWVADDPVEGTLPDGWRALWVYGPSLTFDGDLQWPESLRVVGDTPRPRPTLRQRLARWLHLISAQEG